MVAYNKSGAIANQHDKHSLSKYTNFHRVAAHSNILYIVVAYNNLFALSASYRMNEHYLLLSISFPHKFSTHFQIQTYLPTINALTIGTTTFEEIWQSQSLTSR